VKGDGSTFQRRDRAGRLRWVAALYVPGRPTQVQRTLPVGADEKAAKRELQKLRDKRARGELNPKQVEELAPAPLPTFAGMASAWVAAGYPGGRKAGGPSPRTKRLYGDLVRLRLAPSALGGVSIDAVRRRHVVAFLQEQADGGASRSLVHKLKGVVGRVYRYAQMAHEDELGERGNPADVDLPETKGESQRRALSASQVSRLLAAVGESPFVDAWLRLAIDTGMRPGEQEALDWADIDLKSSPATVTIVKAVAWDPLDGHVVARINDTKTGESGHRRLTLSASTVAALRDYRRWLASAELATPGWWPDRQCGIALKDRVFRRLDGQLVDHQYVSRRLAPVADRAKVGKLTPYETRHTAATLMDELLPAGVAARALGHAVDHGSATTAGYIHRRLTTVPSAVLDLALSQDQAVGE
jgi:integrase